MKRSTDGPVIEPLDSHVSSILFIPPIPEQIPLITNEQCLCENAEHFSPPSMLGGVHPYAMRCEGVVDILTRYGVYPICLECQHAHHVTTGGMRK